MGKGNLSAMSGDLVEVVCGVVIFEGKMLACRRARGDLAGFWEFPGGKVEAGETMEDALRRELQEELSMLVVVGKKGKSVAWKGPKSLIRLTPFLCEWCVGQIIPCDHDEIRWLERVEGDALQWAPADVPIWNGFRVMLP